MFFYILPHAKIQCKKIQTEKKKEMNVFQIKHSIYVLIS